MEIQPIKIKSSNIGLTKFVNGYWGEAKHFILPSPGLSDIQSDQFQRPRKSNNTTLYGCMGKILGPSQGQQTLLWSPSCLKKHHLEKQPTVLLGSMCGSRTNGRTDEDAHPMWCLAAIREKILANRVQCIKFASHSLNLTAHKKGHDL